MGRTLQKFSDLKQHCSPELFCVVLWSLSVGLRRTKLKRRSPKAMISHFPVLETVACAKFGLMAICSSNVETCIVLPFGTRATSFRTQRALKNELQFVFALPSRPRLPSPAPINYPHLLLWPRPLQHRSLPLLSNPFPSYIIDSPLVPELSTVEFSPRMIWPSFSNMRR